MVWEFGVRIFKVKWFVRFARREKVTDESLKEAIMRAERGLIDADLGHGIIKQRVARPGRGRSAGYRMAVAYRAGDRAVFLYGFAKNEQDNIAPGELMTLREIGEAWLGADKTRIAHALDEEVLQEIGHEQTHETQPPDEGAA